MNNNRGGRNSERFVTKRIAHCQNFGRKLRLSFDPPAIVENPWFSTTVVFSATGNTAVTVASVWGVLLNQLGLPTDTTGDLRVVKIRIWGDQGNDASSVQLNTYSFSGVDNNVLSTQLDEPANVRRAHLGYEWPVSDKIVSHAYDSTRRVALLESNATSQVFIGYVDIMWRTLPTTVNRTVSQDIWARAAGRKNTRDLV